ncbi:hypothetical protein DRN75_01165 [Nanoarchaeota archaeon]|nr:MAG: hypothetical protein DRN75_01165 [Nanoarchaeota archaeon]
MAKVTVTICDVCKERIASGACPVCGKDVCDHCTKILSIEMGIKFGPRVEFYKGPMCMECFKKAEANYKEILEKLALDTNKRVDTILRDVLGGSANRPTEPVEHTEIQVKPSKDLSKPEVPEGFNPAQL